MVILTEEGKQRREDAKRRRNEARRRKKATTASTPPSEQMAEQVTGPDCFSNDVLANVLIQRAVRAELERIIRKHIPLAVVIEELGTVSRALQIGVSFGHKVVVGKATLRGASNGGSFDSINDEAMVHVLNFLSSYDRLRCVMFVSKSWYSMRNTSALWQQLDIGRESDVQFKHSHGNLEMSSTGLRNLPQTLDLTTLSHLGIRGCKTDGADHTAWKVFLKSLVCPLTKVAISGAIRKIKVLASLRETDLSQLTSLSVGDGKYEMQSVYPLLEKMPALTVSAASMMSTVVVSRCCQCHDETTLHHHLRYRSY